MDAIKILKIAGTVTTVVGGVMSIASTIIKDQMQDIEIEKKVAKVIEEMNK